MNKIIKISIYIVFCFTLLIFVSCAKNNDSIFNDAVKEINIPSEISDDVNLPQEVQINNKQVFISYRMSNDTLSIDGLVNPSYDEDEEVEITAILTYNNDSKEISLGTFKVLSMKNVCNNIIESFEIPEVVNKDLSFPTKIGKVIIKWNTSNINLLSKKGECAYVSEDKDITISCNLTYKTDFYTYKLDEEYQVKVSPWDYETRFEKIIKNICIPDATVSNIELPLVADYDVNVKWESSDESVISKIGNITRYDIDKTVTLKLTLSSEDNSFTKEYTYEITILKDIIVEGEMNFYKHILVNRARDLNSNQMTNLEYDEASSRIVLSEGKTIGTYESQVINTLDFYRIVGSFSCITNKVATCELEYSIKVDGKWSKYLSYGEYGLGRSNLYYDQTDTDAMIDTDMVIPLNNKVGTAFKYRITLRRDNATTESPKLSLIASTIFMNDYYYAVDASKLPDSVDWEVPKLNQNIVPVIGNSICSATTTTMLLKYAGFDFTDKGYTYEHEYMANMVADRGHNNPTYGNWSYNMMTAGAYGINAYVGKYYSWDEIRYHLANYGPLGVSIGGNFGRYTTQGHLLVLRGYRIENGETTVICNDPNIDEVYYEVPLETFLRCWGSVVYIMEFNNIEIINLK